MLGGDKVGKSSLVSQFMTSEYLHAYDTSIGEFEFIICFWISAFSPHRSQSRGFLIKNSLSQRVDEVKSMEQFIGLETENFSLTKKWFRRKFKDRWMKIVKSSQLVQSSFFNNFSISMIFHTRCTHFHVN